VGPLLRDAPLATLEYVLRAFFHSATITVANRIAAMMATVMTAASR
jgi:hypothetical protein